MRALTDRGVVVALIAGMLDASHTLDPNANGDTRAGIHVDRAEEILAEVLLRDYALGEDDSE